MSYIPHQFNFTHIRVYETTYVAAHADVCTSTTRARILTRRQQKLAITANYVESCVNCLAHWYISSLHSSIAVKRNQSSNLDYM